MPAGPVCYKITLGDTVPFEEQFVLHLPVLKKINSILCSSEVMNPVVPCSLGSSTDMLD